MGRDPSNLVIFVGKRLLQMVPVLLGVILLTFFLTHVAAGPATLELVLAALLLIILIGIPLGVIAANSSGRWPDHLVRIFYLSGWALPTYLLGILLAIFVGPFLGIFRGDPRFHAGAVERTMRA